MKSITILLFCLLATQLFAQETYPRVEKIHVGSKMLYGQIGGSPITIYLKFNRRSNDDIAVYSVEGWYQQNNLQNKISLTGVYAYPSLILYHFSDTAKSNQLLTFKGEDGSAPEAFDYRNLDGYNEKFILSNRESYWLRGNEQQSVRLYQNDLAVQTRREFLVMGQENAFDLHNFGEEHFELIAHKPGKYLLSYHSYSNTYLMGRCGGGAEKGLILLEFDKNNSLIRHEKFVTESCNDSVGSKEEKINDQTLIYHCEDYREDKSYELKVDLRALVIERKDKR